MDEWKFDILFKKKKKKLNEDTQGRAKHYLKEVMDAKVFKFFHWHVVAFIDFMLSDDSFERPPYVALVQHQVRRTIRWLWRIRLVRSFDWKGRRISLDGMDCLDRLHINWRVVQVYRRGCELGNLGKRSLTRFLLLGTSTTWKVVQIHSTGYRLRLSFPYLDGSYLDNWWCN